eukprot:GHVT01059317.1.p1 GENE.GHVT01059317.1~~GHVT01059317.1.p1  ORF type:complete len:103 (-),score=7.46 GHVT01059317.1:211-495(-)
MKPKVCLSFLLLFASAGSGAERCLSVLAHFIEPPQSADVPAPIFAKTDGGYGSGTESWAPNVTPLKDVQGYYGTSKSVPVNFVRESGLFISFNN